MIRFREFVVFPKEFRSRATLGKAISLGAINQALSSATSFGLGVYLVRTLPPYDFGIYGIAFAICLFIAAVGDSLILTQMIVNAPEKHSAVQKAYAGRMLVAVLTYCGIVLGLAGVGAFLPTNGLNASIQSDSYAMGIGGLAVTMLLKGYFVRYASFLHAESRALLINGSLIVSLGLLLAGLHLSEVRVDAEAALWAYACANALAALIGYFLFPVPIKHILWSAMRDDVRDALRGGKWSVLTALTALVRAQAHTIIAAVMLGPFGVAILNAARLFTAPATLITPVFAQVGLPRMAQMRDQNPAEMRRIARIFTNLLFWGAAGYAVVILLLLETVAPYVVGDEYGSLTWLVLAWSSYCCVQALRNGGEMLASAERIFRFQAAASILAAVVTLFSVFLATSALGEVGAVVGLIVGECVLILIYSKRVRSGLKAN